MELRKKKFDYKWVILALAMLMNMVCLGFCSNTRGLFVKAITSVLNIERSLFAFNTSCRFIASAIINLFFGALVHKFGIRKMVAVGFATTVASLVMYAVSKTIVGFCVAGGLMGIGLAFTTTTMTGSIIRRWFTKDVGKYTGIAFAANGVGAAIATPMVSALINVEGDPFAYRNAYYLIIAVTVVVGLLTVVLLKEQPKSTGGQPMPQTAKKRKGAAWHGITFDTALKKPYFYVGAVTIFMTGFSLQGVYEAYAAHMRDVGLSENFVVTLVSSFSLMLTVSKVATGWLYDRFGLKAVMMLNPLAAAVGFTLLAFVAPTTSGMVMAALFGGLFAFALPLETLVVPLIVNDLFGAVSYDRLLGLYAALNYAGYAVGGPLVGLDYDIFGTYKHALLICGGLMVCVSVAFRFILPRVEKTKKEIEGNV